MIDIAAEVSFSVVFKLVRHNIIAGRKQQHLNHTAQQILDPL